MKFPAFSPIELKHDSDPIFVEALRIAYVFPDPEQPRKHFATVALQELALSIGEYGVIQPIIVKKQSDKHYTIIAGERRWRAAQMAGLTSIPVLIQKASLECGRAVSLIENIQREALNPIELAKAYQQLGHDHRLTHEAIAKMIGKNRSTITNTLRLLNLAAEVQALVVTGQLEMGQARALLSIPVERQLDYARKIIDDNLSVRDSEKLIKQAKRSSHKKNKINPYAPQVQAWTDQLSGTLSSRVTININQHGQGCVNIHFTNPNDVERLIDMLSAKTNP